MEKVIFEKVFEDLKTIQSNVVPKSQYEKAQLEIERLKPLLKDANGQVQTLSDDFVTVRTKVKVLETENQELNKNLKMANLESGLILKEFEKLKAEYEEDKLKFDLVKAENKRLLVSLQGWKSNNDVLTWRLKLKGHQLNSLNANIRKNETPEKSSSSIGTQTIKEEPKAVGILNVPTSCSPIESRKSAPRPTKKPNCKQETMKATLGAKRKKFESETQERRKSKRLNNY